MQRRDPRRALGRVHRRAATLSLIAWIGLLSAPMLQAEPHRVEAVGAYPIREALRGKVNPRDEAIQKALWEGVSRVALELIGEEGTPDDLDASSGAVDPAARPMPGPKGSTGPRSTTAPGAAQPDPSERFRKIFGRQILPYTRSFRIVEDRGERPVLFAEEPGVRSEYLVVVEVIVDVDRVEGELARAGLLEVAPGLRSSQSVLIELVGLERYGALQLALDTLRRELSARRIETLEFGPGRQLLRIEGPLGTDEIATRLGRIDTAQLILDPVDVDREGGRIRVLAQMLAPTSAGEEGEPVTASPDTSSPIRP